MIQFERITNENLKNVITWFEDIETQKYVGNSEWIKASLERPNIAIGKIFRGAKVLDRFGLIAYKDELLIGYIEVEIYDKYTECIWDKKLKEVKVSSTEDIISASFVYVVNPDQRSKGYGSEILKNLLEVKILENVELFKASTDIGNEISEICLQKAGFTKLNEFPDFEDVFVWIKRRSIS